MRKIIIPALGSHILGAYRDNAEQTGNIAIITGFLIEKTVIYRNKGGESSFSGFLAKRQKPKKSRKMRYFQEFVGIHKNNKERES